MAEFHIENSAEAERHQQAGDDCDGREHVIDTPRPRQTLEELAPVENPDRVEEHDQPDQTERTGDLGLRGEGTDQQADEEHGCHTEGKVQNTDLPHRITEADGEEECEDRLRPDQLAD